MPVFHSLRIDLERSALTLVGGRQRAVGAVSFDTHVTECVGGDAPEHIETAAPVARDLDFSPALPPAGGAGAARGARSLRPLLLRQRVNQLALRFLREQRF